MVNIVTENVITENGIHIITENVDEIFKYIITMVNIVELMDQGID